ncbi:MAG: NAD(P)/FAD-dependent oxidoreductase [Deltaproteobacteria bacterium]|nr:MAG: NAD(P)/FAD-dependent oxidoreductase [Deltaproteobacteria bacterium]
MNNRYDVVIIGAGPAGLKCAEELKDSNLSVLLVEKKEVIGPKICAGGLTGLAEDFDIPEDRTRTFPVIKIFSAHKQHEVNLVKPFKILDRLDLGQYQLSKIEECDNITILKETFVKSIGKGEITTNRGNFYYRYLVGADGSASLVRRHVGLEPRVCIGVYYDIPGVADDFILYFNPKMLRSGYIWVFPHRDFINIGIYFNPEHLNPRKARDILRKYLTDNGYRFSESNFKGAAINYSYQGCVFNDIFLIGDAAGLATKATGEGISFALTSGSEIAKRILNPDYKMVELDKVLAVKRRQERILKNADKYPFLQDRLFDFSVKLMKKGWFQSYYGV